MGVARNEASSTAAGGGGFIFTSSLLVSRCFLFSLYSCITLDRSYRCIRTCFCRCIDGLDPSVFISLAEGETWAEKRGEPAQDSLIAFSLPQTRKRCPAARWRSDGDLRPQLRFLRRSKGIPRLAWPCQRARFNFRMVRCATGWDLMGTSQLQWPSLNIYYS